MKTDWDYTALAEAYVARAPYSADCLESIYAIAGLVPGSKVCDIGAGDGHLTIPLARAGFQVTAVEPNDAMRSIGLRLTAGFSKTAWVEAYGDATGLPSAAFDLVSFGSSFSVLERAAALREAYRLLKSRRWFTCLWNHRRLDDPVQSHVEEIIKKAIPDYDYGLRREDQTEVIETSGLFVDVRQLANEFTYYQTVPELVKAWNSHATLARQAGDRFKEVVGHIEEYLLSLGRAEIPTPYTTRAWIARRKD